MLKRIREHKCRSYGHDNYYFHNAIQKYGIENFEWSVLYESDDNSVLCEFEQYFIKTNNSKLPYGYNMTDGGEGTVGYKATDEARAKRSALLTGTRRPPMSEATKLKISLSHKGKKNSPEHCEHMRIARLGKSLSDETKYKIGLSGKGRRHTEDAKAKMRRAAIGRVITDEQKEKLRAANLGKTQSMETIIKRTTAIAKTRQEKLNKSHMKVAEVLSE